MKIDRKGWFLLLAGILLVIAGIYGSVRTARADAPVPSAPVAPTYAPSATHLEVSPPPLPRWMLRPCATEDSFNCFWNAQQMGNHRGKSFYVRKMPHTGKRHPLICIFYSNRKEARISDQCWRYDGGGI